MQGSAAIREHGLLEDGVDDRPEPFPQPFGCHGRESYRSETGPGIADWLPTFGGTTEDPEDPALHRSVGLLLFAWNISATLFSQ